MLSAEMLATESIHSNFNQHRNTEFAREGSAMLYLPLRAPGARCGEIHGWLTVTGDSRDEFLQDSLSVIICDLASASVLVSAATVS